MAQQDLSAWQCLLGIRDRRFGSEAGQVIGSIHQLGCHLGVSKRSRRIEGEEVMQGYQRSGECHPQFSLPCLHNMGKAAALIP